MREKCVIFGIDPNSKFYNAGKVVGSVVTSSAVACMIPGSGLTTAYSIATAATTTYGSTLRNDLKTYGGIENMTDDQIRKMGSHARTSSYIAGGAAAISHVVNNNVIPLRTGGDVGTRTVRDYIAREGGRVLLNVGANATIGAGSNLASQYSDIKYGNRDSVNWKAVGNSGAASAVTATANAYISARNPDRKVTKWDDIPKEYVPEAKKLERAIERAATAKAKAVSYATREFRRDHGVSNVIIKNSASTASTIIKKVGDNSGNK